MTKMVRRFNDSTPANKPLCAHPKCTVNVSSPVVFKYVDFISVNFEILFDLRNYEDESLIFSPGNQYFFMRLKFLKIVCLVALH